MEPKIVSLGSSLLVPCVQELAKQPMKSVPSQYIRRPHEELINVSDTNHLQLHQVPAINMGSLLSQDSMDSELAKLHSACKQWGFFQLVNHGVSCSLLEKINMEIQEFFNLPMEEKKKFWQYSGEIEGFGQAFVVSEEQKLDWADMFFMTTLPIHMRKPHLFPKLPLPFRETLEVYLSEVKNLAMAILAQMAKALKMEEEEMRECFEDGMQSMRMTYYPPCPQPEQVIGLTPHSDAVALTILMQVNEVDGLQIKKDGMWVPLKALPNAFIINIGDILEIITNGAYRSIEHRAVVNSVKERLSFATFFGPRFDGEIGPASALITAQNPPLFTRVGVQDYYRGLFVRELNGRSYLDAMRIQNNHHQGS